MGATISPTLLYEDPRAAIAWLEEAFGFTPVAVHEQDGEIAHAELSYGDGVVMLGKGPHKDSYGVYVAVRDPDGHHARAVAAGAEVTRQPADQSYGSRDYAARDPEGNEWFFGTWVPKIG